jgi:hypothetical protein
MIRVNLSLLTDDTCLYTTELKEGYDPLKLQRRLDSIAAWCERWNIQINEDKLRAMYFSHRIGVPESLLTLNGWIIPFVNSGKYLSVIVDKKNTWRLHMETIISKVFRTFVRIFSFFKSERLGTNIKLTLDKALVSSVILGNLRKIPI